MTLFTDPLVFASTVVAILVVALIASRLDARRIRRRQSEQHRFTEEHASRQRLGYPLSTRLAAPQPPPVSDGARRDLQATKGASDGVTSTPAGAADTSLHRPRSDFDAHMPTRNERARRR